MIYIEYMTLNDSGHVRLIIDKTRQYTNVIVDIITSQKNWLAPCSAVLRTQQMY